MADLFRNKYRIPTVRAQWWDYGRDGAYFITICTHGRQHFFGEVYNGEMRLSQIGQIATDKWKEIPDHFPFVHLDEFVVMPNHMHGIIIIDRRNTVEPLQATARQSMAHSPLEPLPATALPRKNEAMAAISPKSGSLPTIIRSYKSAVSKEVLPNSRGRLGFMTTSSAKPMYLRKSGITSSTTRFCGKKTNSIRIMQNDVLGIHSMNVAQTGHLQRVHHRSAVHVGDQVHGA